MNETQTENTNPGTTAWQLTNPASNREIEGYASRTSVNRGGSIAFYINTSAASYTLEIYRTGWYGGAGGRLLIPAVMLNGIVQPMPTPDPTTNLVECNWVSQYTLTVPNTWVSGVYLVKLVALGSGKQSYIVFVVREDSRNSAILFKTAVTTYQAYNNWPGPGNNGHSLYTFNSTNSVAAFKVSFNRPYYQDPDPTFLADVGSMYYLRWEYNMVRWMEMSGYDVTYDTDIDVHETPNVLLAHKAVLSVGHDEYWSTQMRSAFIAARDAGIGIGFFSGNVCYWQIRLEASAINGAADRNIVGYKEHASLDPVGSSSCLLTTFWRQNPCVPSEQSFIGVEYIYSPVNTDIVIVNPSHWSLAGTGLSNGAHLVGLSGYEVDGNADNNSPVGTTVIASSPVPNTNLFSQMVSYTAASGATVFATGSIQWSWGVDDWGAPSQRPARLSPAAQQITSNVLARLTGGTVTQPQPLVSDEFNGATLNTSVWTFLNPTGGSYSLNGTKLVLSVPGGATHDPHDPASGANNAVRVMQAVTNTDFDVIVKFDTIPTAAYTSEGIIVEQGPNDFLRFEVYGVGGQTYIYASKIVGGGETNILNSPIAAGTGSVWLEVKRSGNSWTQSWSKDGSQFTAGTTFAQTITVARIGPFASNYFNPASATPAFTASIDYFRNSSSTTAPSLTITKSHAGNLVQGGTGTYTVTVSNAGNAPTSGTVTVTDTLPTGLTATAFSGSGWSCLLTPTVNCSRGDALAAGATYPAMTLTVSVAANAPGTVTNTATVAGGGTTTNNTASDPTTITGGSTGGAPVSDEFNSVALNTGLWTLVNPAGGSYSVNGAELLIAVPGGASHDPTASGSDLSVRIFQPIANADFDVIVKFDAVPTAAYTNEGIIVEQGPSDFVRFEIYGTGGQPYLYASKIVGGAETVAVNAPIAAGSGSFWLEVKRTGNNWTQTWSKDGSQFTTGATFTQAMTVARIGPFASNYFSPASGAPAFTAAVDYFRNASSITTAPNLSIAKTHSGNFVQGGTGAYTITVSNVGNAPSNGTVTVTDTLPTGLTATAFSGSGWSCSLTPTVKCSRGDALAAGATYPVMTLTVSVASNAPVSVTNTVTVAGGGTTTNNTANDPTTITSGTTTAPSLAITKSHTGNFTQGAAGTYTMAVSNVGNAPTSGTVTVTDTLPTGLTATAFSGSGWSCSLTPTLSCSRGDALAAGAAYPAMAMTVSVASNAPASVTNTATAAGGGTTTNSTANDPTTITSGSTAGAPISDEFNNTTLNTGLWTFFNPAGGSNSLNGTQLLLAAPAGATHDPHDPASGANNAVRVMQTIANADFDVIAKFDTIPTAAYTNEGIIVEQGPSDFLRFEVYGTGGQTYIFASKIVGGAETLVLNSPIAAGSGSLWLEVKRAGNNWTQSWSKDGSQFTTATTFAQTITVARIGPFASNYFSPASATPAFTASVDYFRNASTTTTAPNLAITKSHTGNFVQGGTGTYSVSVSNAGTAPTSGTVTVTDTLPTGLTATALTGSGWSCSLTPTLSCSRGDALAAGATYPAMTLAVSVAANAPASVTNTANAAGGGTTGNKTVNDPTTITGGSTAPNLAITKSHTGNFAQGGTGTYTISVSNGGNAPTSGTVTVTDTLPTGLTATAFSGSGWSCSLTPTLSCSRGDALAAGATYPAMSLAVSVAANAPASVTNSATAAGGGTTGNKTVNDPTTITGATGGGPVSDEFNNTTLNTGLWTFLNPAGGSNSLNGTQLLLTAPAGATHDPTASGKDDAIRVMQTIPNADFDVIVKFDSIPTAAYTNEGIIVEQGPIDFLRFEVYGTGGQTYIFASTVTNSTDTLHLNSPIAAGGGSFWMRVKRVGNVWTQTWSTDGTNYQPGTSFTQAVTVARIGPFASNYFSPASTTPAFTASVDYFRFQ